MIETALRESRGTGVRALRRSSQAGCSRFDSGLKDQVAQDRQEPL